MPRFDLAPLFLAGCFVPAFMNSRPPHDPSNLAPPVFEPGMTELEVTNDAVLYAIATSWGQDVHYVLLRGTDKVAEGDLQAAGEELGGIQFVSQRAHELYNMGIRTGAPLEAGDYTLQMTLTWVNEWDEKSTVAGVEHFRVAHVPSTTGGTVAIDPTTLTAHAAIRDHRRDPNIEHDANGERMELPDPAFWITLPTPIGIDETRVDLLFTQNGKLGGRATNTFPVDSDLADDVLQMPVRVWGWPKELTPAVMHGHAGIWQVHVVQDGRYITTCDFRATATGFASADASAGEQPHSAKLDCAPAQGAEVAAALATVEGVSPRVPDRKLAREALALSRSKEVRDQRAAVAKLEKSIDRAETMAGYSAEARAMDNQRDYQDASQRLQRELPRARARYAALIEKYASQPSPQ